MTAKTYEARAIHQGSVAAGTETACDGFGGESLFSVHHDGLHATRARCVISLNLTHLQEG